MIRHLLAAGAVLLLGACSSSSSLLSVEPPATLTDFKPTFVVRTEWAQQVGEGVGRHFTMLTPLVDHDHIYAADRGGRVDAFTLESGSSVWRRSLETAVSAGVGDGGDLLLLGGDAEVMALAKSDGRLSWRAQVSSEVLAAPVRGGDVVVVRTVDGGMYGLDAGDGHRLWRYSQDVPLLSLRGVGEPQIRGGIVVAGFANGHVVALTLQDGRVIWEAALAVARGRTELERMVDVDARLVVDQGVVFAASYQGRIAALTLDSGRLLWTRDFSTYSGIAADGRDLYVSDADGNLWALDRSNGATQWKQGVLHGRALSAPVVQGGAVVVADYEGYLHWLSREDGSLAARSRVIEFAAQFPSMDEQGPTPFKEDRAVLAAPQVQDDWVVAMDKRGAIDAFKVEPSAR